MLYLCLVTLIAASAASADTLSNLLPGGVPQHRPILIAHRGGAVAPDAPECSPTAIARAAASGFDMVELDVQPIQDNTPIVFHDRTLEKATGASTNVADLSPAKAAHLRFQNGDPVHTLQQALEQCRGLGLGVMLDIKRGESEAFFNGIRNALEKTGYLGRVLCINRAQAVLEHLRGAVITRVNETVAENLAVANADAMDGGFWFGLPSDLPDALIKPLQAKGILVIPAINTFRYDEATHLSAAEADIKRLCAAGVDGLQIDSVYHELVTRICTPSAP